MKEKETENRFHDLTSAPIIKWKLEEKRAIDRARGMIGIVGIERGEGIRKCRTGTLGGIARVVIPSRKLERRQS